MGEDGPRGKFVAEMMHERFVGKAVEAVAADASIVVALRKREMSGDFGHGLVEDVVEAGELRNIGKCGFRGVDELEGLRDVDGREVDSCFELIDKFWRDFLVRDETWPAMNNAVTYANGCGVHVFANGGGDGGERVALRFENVFALHEEFTASGIADLQGTVGMADAVGAASEEWLFVGWTAGVEAEFQRGGAAVDDEDEIGGRRWH